MGKLDGKNIIITGGSLGIGLRIAKKCKKEGAAVIISARHKESLDAAFAELEDISGLESAAYELDVSQNDRVVEFSSWCSKRYSRIHGVVNCAGIYGPIGKAHEVDLNEFISAIQINFLGTFYMCRAFIPLLKKVKGRRKIVNYAGGGAASPFPNYSAYATSKAAVVRLTENLSLELAEDNIDVNCVAPGFVITRLHQQTLAAGPEGSKQSFYETTKKQMENGGIPPEKAADLTSFLLSSDSDGITGKFISAPWDPWKETGFQARLKADKDLATLRRIDDKMFFKRGNPA